MEDGKEGSVRQLRTSFELILVLLMWSWDVTLLTYFPPSEMIQLWGGAENGKAAHGRHAMQCFKDVFLPINPSRPENNEDFAPYATWVGEDSWACFPGSSFSVPSSQRNCTWCNLCIPVWIRQVNILLLLLLRAQEIVENPSCHPHTCQAYLEHDSPLARLLASWIPF